MGAGPCRGQSEGLGIAAPDFAKLPGAQPFTAIYASVTDLLERAENAHALTGHVKQAQEHRTRPTSGEGLFMLFHASILTPAS